MTTHILSMTYQPKIEGVRNGTIRQTIRLYNEKRPFKVLDRLLIHGWTGKPYRSPWSWRIEGEIEQIAQFDAFNDHVEDRNNGFEPYTWQKGLNWIARLDGISPPTGLELKSVLERYHGKFTDKPVRFQVIRW